MSVEVGGSEVRISHAGALVACHAERYGRRERAVLPGHLHGIVASVPGATASPRAPTPEPPRIELLRPLSEYEHVAGGGW